MPIHCDNLGLYFTDFREHYDKPPLYHRGPMRHQLGSEHFMNFQQDNYIVERKVK